MNIQAERKECEQCGASMEASTGSRFCSPECYYDYERRDDVECDSCGGSFHPQQENQQYCSHQCRAESQKNKVTLTCSVCGEAFEVPKYREDSAVTCSKECHDVWQSETRSGEDHHGWRDDVETDVLVREFKSGLTLREVADRHEMSIPGITPRLKRAGVDIQEILEERKNDWVTLVCEECSEEFEVDEWWEDKRRFCSRACSASAGIGWLSTKETSFGLEVKSSYEVEVAEYLHQNGYDFEYEPKIPGRYIPDFTIDDGVIIEVWGMMDSESYRERRRQKEAWYEENGYELISIEPEDMDNLKEVMSG